MRIDDEYIGRRVVEAIVSGKLVILPQGFDLNKIAWSANAYAQIGQTVRAILFPEDGKDNHVHHRAMSDNSDKWSFDAQSESLHIQQDLHTSKGYVDRFNDLQIPAELLPALVSVASTALRNAIRKGAT